MQQIDTGDAGERPFDLPINLEIVGNLETMVRSRVIAHNEYRVARGRAWRSDLNKRDKDEDSFDYWS